jgi:hypothetical protein
LSERNGGERIKEKPMELRRTLLVGAILLLTALAACATAKPDQPPAQSSDGGNTESGLTANMDVPTSLDSGATVMAGFTCTNTSSDGVHVLKWFTPLEGIAGDIFRVERDGVELAYRGKLVKRGPPISEDYVWLEAGESVSAQVDMAEGYDFSQAGLYTIEFRSPRVSHVAKAGTKKADSFEELGMIQIPSNTVKVSIGTVEGERTPDAKQVTIADGGHMLLGHEERVRSEIGEFLDEYTSSKSRKDG